MASPLILRPYQSGEHVFGLAIVLESSRIPPGGLKLANESDHDREGNPVLIRNPKSPVPYEIPDDYAKKIEPLSHHVFDDDLDNALDAFMNFLEDA